MADVLTPYTDKGQAMSPIEVGTGVVLPIWPGGGGRTNLHHSAFYRRNWLNGPRQRETRAVRFSRLQRIPVRDHTEYHRVFYGTAFPENERQSFGIVLLNSVFYIPGHAVDMSGLQPTVVETTPRMRKALMLPGMLTVEAKRGCRREIGQFLMEHAVSQDFNHVKRALVEEFIALAGSAYENDEIALRRRLRLGMRLANIGLGLATDRLDRTYQQARREGALPGDAPVCAWEAAKKHVRGHESDYFDTLAQNLAAQCQAA